MDKPKTLEEANALLLERRKVLGIDATPRPIESSLNLSHFKLPTPEEAAAAAARAEAREKENREAEERSQKQRAEEYRQRRLARAQIPERHANRDLAPGAPEWYAALGSLRKNLGRGFLVALLGIRGAGKTQLAVECIRHVINEGRDARYVKAMDLAIRFREAFRKDGPSERAVLDEFADPGLLVIDAMEERAETEFEDRMISHLIDLRYDALLDTILISNQTREAFGESVGKSAVSRLIETGKVIECNWESFRKKSDTTPARTSSSLPVGDRS